MDLMMGLSAISQSLEIVKRLRELEKANHNADLKMALADLSMALADAKLGLASAKEQIAEKSEQLLEANNALSALKDSHKLRVTSVYYRGFSFGIDHDGHYFAHPFCPKCEQEQGSQYVLTPISGMAYRCPSCDFLGHGRIPILPKDFERSNSKD